MYVLYVGSYQAFVVRIPKKSLLSPSRTAAVCGGNVLTSQRIVDVVFKAFHACAASQGCTKYAFGHSTCAASKTRLLSNLTFGTGGKDKDGKAVAGWGYYEVRSVEWTCARTHFFEDNCWGFRSWARLARYGRCTYPHHEYTYWRRRTSGTAVPCHDTPLWTKDWVCWGWQVARR
jgi:hypothetical protein